MLDEIVEIIKDHMDKQPYEIKCYNCGKELNFTKKLDNDLDLFIEIDPCPCIKND